jgi:hypothetical protein
VPNKKDLHNERFPATCRRGSGSAVQDECCRLLSLVLSVVNQKSGTYTHHAIATFEIELTDILDFDVSFVWDRTQDPQVRGDGSVPKQDDFQMLFTLGVNI